MSDRTDRSKRIIQRQRKECSGLGLRTNRPSLRILQLLTQAHESHSHQETKSCSCCEAAGSIKHQIQMWSWTIFFKKIAISRNPDGSKPLFSKSPIQNLPRFLTGRYPWP
ncbi:MAG TPA: hypothetical protein DGU45_06520 [Planctomycetes bacterium]|nr:hypothetical protein [Planctomycetota bacterium]